MHLKVSKGIQTFSCTNGSELMVVFTSIIAWAALYAIFSHMNQDCKSIVCKIDNDRVNIWKKDVDKSTSFCYNKAL